LAAVPALSCPDCHTALTSTGPEVRCATCGAAFPRVDGVVSFLRADASVEEDYLWDFASDPRISRVTEARWRLLTRLIDGVDVGPTVVAVGAGGEHWPARRLDGRVEDYVVVDTSARQLARQWFPSGARGTAVRAAGERLPLADASADTVEMWSVLDHFVDPAAAIAEAARIVRPGGNLVIALGNDGSWYRRAGRRLDPGDSHAHLHRFDPQAVANLLRGAFEVTSVQTLGYLRLPNRIERLIGERIGPGTQERLLRLTDAALRRVLGPHAGGMMFIVARSVRLEPGATT
jgi:SAM-dependent methyltransferase